MRRLAALLLVLVTASAPREEAPRLIVYVLFDTLGARHVSHLGYGRATTPHLDALAAEGVTFTRAVSPAPYAVASIPSLMTGRYPDRHGLVDYAGKLPPEETTLAEHLREAGYRTVGLSSVFNGGPRFGNDQGFERFVELYRGEGPEGATRIEFQGEACHVPGPQEGLAVLREELDGLGAEGRLFLFLHILQPHAPYDPPREFLERFRDADYPGPYRDGERERLRREAGRELTEEVRQGIRHLYDANLAWGDTGLGAVVAELRERDLFDEALIVATGNHGEAFWEHGRLGHGVHIYEEQMHATLVVKLPREDGLRGQRRSQLASNMDLVPTILERVGASYDSQSLDARSLLDAARDERAPAPHERLVLRSEPKPKAARLIGLRWKDTKVLVTLTEGEGPPRAARVELYDLNEDPLEQHDLAPDDPERAEGLAREALQAWTALRAGGN